MADKPKGIIISANDRLSEALTAEVRPLVDVVQRIGDPLSAIGLVKEQQPGVIFLDITDKRETARELTGRIMRRAPGASVFIIAPDKDPDLILEGLRCGVADYLVFPDQRKEILSAVRRALGRSDATGKTGEIFALFSPKGGQGVTSLAINLADRICALTGDKVLLLDLNLYKGDVNIYLDLQSGYTPFDLLKDLERMDNNLLFSSLTRHENGVYILTTPEEISDADQVTGDDIRRVAVILRKYFDFVVVDLPHDFSEKTLCMLEEADKVLVVTQQGLPEIKNLQSALALFQELNHGKDKIKIVLNRYEKNSELTPDDLAGILKHPITSIVDNDYRAVTEGINEGKTIADSSPKAKIKRQLDSLAGLLTGMKPEVQDKVGWKNVFSLFSG